MPDPNIYQRTFNHFLELWILPEIARRKERGLIPDNFSLSIAQVLFSLDERQPIVRLNKECKIVAKVKVRKSVEKGELATLDKIDSFENISLVQEEEPYYAHVSAFLLKDEWIFAFDFRYNKGLARQHLKAAKEFYETARLALSQDSISPFIDNLFSAIELLAKSELLLMPDKDFYEKATHKGIQCRYNQHVNLGNAKIEYKSALNKLASLRNSARYLKSEFRLAPNDGQEFIKTAMDMIDYVENRLL